MNIIWSKFIDHSTVCFTVYAAHIKETSSPVNSPPHKGQVTRKRIPFDVIMIECNAASDVQKTMLIRAVQAAHFLPCYNHESQGRLLSLTYLQHKAIPTYMSNIRIYVSLNTG